MGIPEKSIGGLAIAGIGGIIADRRELGVPAILGTSDFFLPRTMKLLFPRAAPAAPAAQPKLAECPTLAGAEIAGVVHGMRVGGDLYHFLRPCPGRVVFGLLDVAGHRVENEAIVSAAHARFQQSGSELFRDVDVNEADAMMDFCMELNATIRRHASGICVCAAFVGCYNEELGTICYVNAGHTPGLLRHDEEITELRATGLPLGLFAASTYEAPTAFLPRGASLLLVSRGVVEASRKKEEFGIHGVRNQFLSVPLQSATTVAATLLDAVRQHLGATPAHNDLTALALVRAA